MVDVPPLDALASTVRDHPSIGIHRSQGVAWQTPRLHPTTADVVIVEDHGGFAFGGNKVRHLDLILGLARNEGADVAITAAGAQSNLCRVLAAACCYVGMDVHLVQRGDQPWNNTGNQALYELTGASVDRVATDDPFSEAQDQLVAVLAERYRGSGRRPFIVDVRREHAPVSALAQTQLLAEVDLPWVPDTLVVAASAGSTAAGLLLSVAVRGWHTRLLAVSASIEAATLRRRVLRIAERAATAAGFDAEPLRLGERLFVTDEFLGGGHGVRTASATAAATHTARQSGIFLDGTYTGKAMAALLAQPSPGRTCFIHTGGGPTIFLDPTTQGAPT